MAEESAGFDAVDAVAQLEEPNRRRLYDFVVAGDGPIGRDEAAGAMGISRELAAFHLDRLVEAGMLETEYRRRGGRRGPGAGRPAKLYRRAVRQIAVSFPPRSYDVAAGVMATAFDRLAGSPAHDAVGDVARERGVVAGTAVRRVAGPRPSGRRLRTKLLDVFQAAGYEPDLDVASGTVTLRNCPFEALAADHRALTCGMNLAWAEGVVSGLGDRRTEVELDPQPGRCCVLVHLPPDRPKSPTAADAEASTS